MEINKRNPLYVHSGGVLKFIMRTILLLFCATAFALTPEAGMSQKIKINEDKTVSVDEVFRIIRSQTKDFMFIYQTDLFKDLPEVELKKGTIRMDQLINQSLSTANLNVVVTENNTILIKEMKKGEQRQVTGKVLDEVGTPIPGVTVRVKGTTLGVATDFDGKFSILAPSPENVLVFTSVGFENKEITVGDQTHLTVVMKETVEELDEVVLEYSTGYQEIPEERATGSFSQVNKELFNRRISTNVIDRLEDVTSGLIINRAGSAVDPVAIRGRSTIFGNPNPLIVIDNVPYDGDLNNLNPNDVESITVLKDAAAASIWGARAGNGVIVVVTKKGKINQPIQVSFNSNITMVEKPDLFYTPRMSIGDHIDTEVRLFEQGFYNSTEASIFQDPLSPVIELKIAQRDGLISETEAESRINALKSYDVRNDMEKYFYRTQYNQQYALNINGGSENSRYAISAGYDNNIENLVGNKFERITFNVGNSMSFFNNRLELNTNLYYTKNQRQRNNQGSSMIRLSDAESIYPYAKLVDDNGMALPIIRDYRIGFVEDAMNNGLLDWRYRPLKEIELTDNSIDDVDYRITTGLKVNITDSFKADVLYQYWRNDSESKNLRLAESYFARNLIYEYTEDVNGDLSKAIPEGGILDFGSGTSYSHTLRAQLSYSKVFGELHELVALAGYEAKTRHFSNQNFRFYGYDDEIANSSPVDYINRYSQYYFPLFTLQIPNVDGQSEGTNNFISWYGNAAYTYNKKYTISGSIRKDKSNIFGVNANQRGVPLWSVGTSWNISKESFFDINWLPYLKFRASYGYNGNLYNDITALTTVRILGNNSLVNTPYSQITNPPYPDLKWERIEITNFGLDFSVKNNVFNGSIEYYTKKGYDLIGFAPIAPSSGSATFRGNTAETDGHGIDITLNSKNITSRNFQWTTSLLFSTNKVTVRKYKDEETASNLLVENGQFGNYLREGNSLFGIYSYDWGGLDPENGNPRGFLNGELSTDYSSLVNIDPEELNYHGSARPEVFGAIRNSITWKGLTLSANISYRFDYYFRRPSIRYGSTFGLGGHGDYYLRWQNQGDEINTDVPSIPETPDGNRDAFYIYSENLVEKGDHIRLQDVRLSYSLRDNKLPFKNISFYIYANNLGILWKKTDKVPDPDFLNSGSQRSFSLGTKLEF